MATNILTASAGTPSVGTKGPRQFQGLFEVIPFKVTVTEDSVTAQVASQVDIPVPGAELGDFVLVTPTVDAAGLIPYGFVQSANTVTISVYNVEGTDAITSLAGGVVFNGLVLKPKGVFDSL